MRILIKKKHQESTLTVHDAGSVKEIVQEVLKLYQDCQFALNQEEIVIRQGLTELIVNSIEHGALGMGSQKKYELKRKGEYEDYLNNKIKNSDKTIEVNYIETETKVEVVIFDYGNGFAWKHQLMAVEAEKDGKGVWIAKNSFDELTYNDIGNCTKAIVYKGN